MHTFCEFCGDWFNANCKKMHICTNVHRANIVKHNCDLSCEMQPLYEKQANSPPVEFSTIGTTTMRRSYSFPLLDTIAKHMMEPAADMKMMNAVSLDNTSHISAGFLTGGIVCLDSFYDTVSSDGADNVPMLVDDSAAEKENIFMMQPPHVGSFDNFIGSGMTSGEAGLHKCISQSQNSELNVICDTPILAREPFNTLSLPDLVPSLMLRGVKRALDMD